MKKRCSKCKIEKEKGEFYKRKDTKDGLQYKCKPCMKKGDKQYYQENKEKIAEYDKRRYQKFRDQFLKQQKQYRQNHKVEIAKYSRKYYREHKQEKSEYNTWRHMINRCYNTKDKDYKYYGARGIKVCNRWLNSFEDFKEDMGSKPQNLTLDRINNDGDYEPSNCKWVTRKEQANNRRKRKNNDEVKNESSITCPNNINV